MNDCSYAEKGYATRILSGTRRGLAGSADQRDYIVFECQFLTRKGPVEQLAENSRPRFVIL